MPNHRIPNDPVRKTTSQTIMAFDFGTQKIGIAVGESLIESSTPLALFPVQDGIPDWQHLCTLIQTWQPHVFLVGLPLNMDESESDLSRRARKFARRLRHHTQITTWMVDERLTTREARHTLNQYHAKKQGKKLQADSIAAALLIEQWYRHSVGIIP